MSKSLKQVEKEHAKAIKLLNDEIDDARFTRSKAIAERRAVEIRLSDVTSKLTKVSNSNTGLKAIIDSYNNSMGKWKKILYVLAGKRL